MNNDMFGKCGMTQFVGVGVCDTIGLYIANIDDDLRKQMNIPEKVPRGRPYRFPYRCGSTNSSR